MAPKGPYKLVTVNNAPERAQRIVGRVVEVLKDQYTIIYAANAESPEAAKAILEEVVPDIVFTASMWTPEQSSRIMAEAKEVNPKVKTLALPQGLQVQKGPDAVVEYIKEQLPALIES
ncbi:hypothetical protein LTR36_000181 [Oleoguttula mirabilis]|uniref:Uncharacterized protein n=1 Tax=Oleoguttula mirabilis TaxID=1507867 RepID=A0AAV9JY35_9PEZI|nr:hypothetical protein LTR36_000181 [Oleoguttula mirabilis]